MKFLPTILSLSRIAAAPFVWRSITSRDWDTAVPLCILFGLTDLLDGQLARRFGWTSRFGAWSDAIGDKVLLGTVYIALAVAGRAPAWLVGLVFGRDVFILLMAAIGLLFTRIRDFPPSLWGKLSTNVQIATALVLLLDAALARPWFIGLCTVTTVLSGLHYFYSGILRLRAIASKAD